MLLRLSDYRIQLQILILLTSKRIRLLERAQDDFISSTADYL